ncbi:MAG: excinuclease ABC subunit UvrC [Chloroflexota bacterium]|nr:excinuclease ABC subunit UvrC [Chloroflexota bacterium]
MVSERIQRQLTAVPASPGVYLMRDAAGEILYVGKAINLRNRLRSYFQASASHTPKIRKMVERIADFEFIVTDSELEALILECTLIKRHRPRYNVVMKDDKNYPYLKVTNEPFPKVVITRRLLDDGARYFGPYADVGSVRRTLDLLNKLFPYRSCDRPITGTDTRPCLDYHIKRCLGPCIGAVDEAGYRDVINQVILFLEGRQEEVIARLRAQMEAAAENLEFERAAALRDQIAAVEKVAERQKVVSAKGEDQDVIAFARNNGEACVQVFFIRNGRLIGREHFILQGTSEEDGKQIVASFVKQFYDQAPEVPPTILLPNRLDEEQVIEAWLRDKRGGQKVRLQVPKQGDRKKLVELVAENAQQVLEQMRAKWLADDNRNGAALRELADALGLAHPPARIECYDISTIHGTATVASMVVFENGKPKSAHYRRFRIKSVPGNNDYAAMEEVLRRRLKYLAAPRAVVAAEGEASTQRSETNFDFPAPDLILVDGGKGQLSVASDVLRDLGLASIPVAALAKEQEALFLPSVSDPVLLPATSPALYLVQRIRDEAHRFAVAYHRKVRSRGAFESELDQVRGIGPRRKKALLRHFGSVKAIREASVDDLAAVVGMTRRLAEKLKSQL